MSENSLLKKCLHGRTQNVNEAFNAFLKLNAFVWKRAPKDIFVGKNVSDIYVASAVIAFNDGALGNMKVMEKIGLHTGHFNVEASRIVDLVRIPGVGYHYKGKEKVKIRRKTLHAQKKGLIMSITRIMGQGCINYTFLYYII